MSSSLGQQVFNLLDMKTLADRLKAAIDQAGVSQSELARAVGISRSAVSLWMNGSVAGIAGENLLRTAAALRVSPMWLSTGRGSMKADKPEEIDLEGNPNYPAIRRVRLRLSAGISGYAADPVLEDHAPLVFSRGWYDRNGYKPEKLIAVEVTGASMEPGLYGGDWVVVNLADVTAKDGDVFAINFEGEATIKRLFRDPQGWIAASDNPDKRLFRDRLLTDRCFIVGKIVHKQSERI
ncbi:XRE family transcriptional regulator [Robbsia andropogonis]|uniref:XRE family transcriptional regulator n=1 Tax=Robbsia andropogonis TaxID=28092 RepID=UPI003D1CB960